MRTAGRRRAAAAAQPGDGVTEAGHADDLADALGLGAAGQALAVQPGVERWCRTFRRGAAA
jgi:hypothetical protein